MTYVMLILGFVLLFKGADFFVEGSSAVARKLHIPAMVIGMTIVAMGTSLPECAVSVTASIAGSNELAVSNVVGSNIFNLMVVCGACALWTPMAVSQSTLKQELPFSIAMGLILLILGYSGMEISRADGLIFHCDFCLFSHVDGACSKGEFSTTGRRGGKDTFWLEMCALHSPGRSCHHVGR